MDKNGKLFLSMYLRNQYCCPFYFPILPSLCPDNLSDLTSLFPHVLTLHHKNRASGKKLVLSLKYII